MTPLVVISGATRGLGLALAGQFVAHGWQVAGCGTDAGALAQAQEHLGAAVLLRQVDVTDAAQVQAWADSLPAAPQLVIANAGVIHAPARAWELDPAALERNMTVNFYGTVNMARAFVPLLGRAGGTLLAMSSEWGRAGAAGMAGYCASKFAVEGFMASLARDVPPGVRVHTIDPGGGIETGMIALSAPDEVGLYPTPESWAARAYPFLTRALEQFPDGLPLTVGQQP